MRAVVLALADLGRSARMQYHARALAACGVEIDFVGYTGTPLPRAIDDEPRIHLHRLAPSTLRIRQSSGIEYAFRATIDAFRLSFRLWRTLRKLPRPDLVLLQNPPA